MSDFGCKRANDQDDVLIYLSVFMLFIYVFIEVLLRLDCAFSLFKMQSQLEVHSAAVVHAHAGKGGLLTFCTDNRVIKAQTGLSNSSFP